MPLALLLAAAHAAIVTVDADALRVRERPDTGAAVVAHLRMGTRVEAGTLDGAWVQVHMVGDPDTTGWVHRDFLTGAPVQLESVRRQALAGDADAVRRWFALDPADEAAQELRMAQGNEGASWVAAWQDAPTWIAHCGGGGAVLLGSVDAEGVFTAAVGGMDEAALRALGGELSGTAWYAAQDEGRPMAGTPFPHPTPRAVVDVLADEGSPLRLDLGRCTVGVVSTRPLTALTPTGVDPETLVAAAAPLGARFRDGVTRLGARRVHPDLPLLEISAEAPTTVDTDDEIRAPMVVGRIGLAWPDGRVVSQQGGVGLDTDMDWVALSGTSDPTLLGVAPMDGPYASATVLHVVRLTPAGPQVQAMSLWLWEGGC